MKTIIIGFILSYFAHSGFAQGPPINTDTPIMLGLQGGGLRSFVKVVHKSLNNSNGDSPEATSIVAPIAIPINLFSDKLQIGIIIPYKTVELKINDLRKQSSGLGDSQVFIKFLLYQADAKNETFRVASKIILKFPSGNESLQPALGSGSTDVILSSVAGWIKHRVGVYLETQYAINGLNTGLNYGDAFFYNLAFGYRLLPKIYNRYQTQQLNLFFEINGISKFADTVPVKTINSGDRTTIFISPGLQFVGGSQWLIEATYQYPAINNRNNQQLSEEWTVALGFRILFNLQ